MVWKNSEQNNNSLTESSNVTVLPKSLVEIDLRPGMSDSVTTMSHISFVLPNKPESSVSSTLKRLKYIIKRPNRLDL